MKFNPPYPVDTITTHNSAHNDEQVTLTGLDLHGSVAFPGVARATVKYTGDPDSWDGERELIVNKNLCVGLGGHILDEHVTPNEEICCADLLVQRLEIKDPAFLRLVEETRFHDRNAGTGMFELPSLIKKWYRDKTPRQVRSRATRWYRDLLAYEAGHRASDPVRISMAGMAELMRRRNREHMHMKRVRRIYNYLLNADKEDKPRLFDMTNMMKKVALMQEREMRNTFLRLCSPIIDDAVKYTIEWQAEYDRYIRNFQRILVPDTNVEINLAREYSDHPDRVSVARAHGAHVVVLQNTRGNIQIFTQFMHNSKRQFRPYLTLQEVIKAIRRAELVKRRMTLGLHSEGYWAQPGKIREIKWWFYHGHGEAAYNGTNQSSTDVEVTMLTLDEVLGIVRKYIRLHPAFESVDYRQIYQYDVGEDEEMANPMLDAEVSAEEFSGDDDLPNEGEAEANSDETVAH